MKTTYYEILDRIFLMITIHLESFLSLWIDGTRTTSGISFTSVNPEKITGLDFADPQEKSLFQKPMYGC